MVWGVPKQVKTFFAKPVRGCSKPIRSSLAAMELAFLLAPHRRCLKTIAGSVLEHRHQEDLGDLGVRAPLGVSRRRGVVGSLGSERR